MDAISLIECAVVIIVIGFFTGCITGYIGYYTDRK
jgi:hypothetical protein